ncbi:MAG: DNA repair protein [Clostridia bacterium]|nr:DNA repair protein [Clostridia bacterium]MBQ8912176.1 DNA repair protein [Clostridia bacterium]
MTEKELKKLNRKQLLELLLMQTDRADQLERKLAQLEKRLSDRNIAEMEAGSIAEAALKLNGVFEAAEAAAAQYLENIRRLSQHLEEAQDPVEWEQLPEEGADGDGET